MHVVTGAFLFALVAAAGPTIIHLLNRRRFRTVQWGAMRFVRDAVRRNKRLLRIRDLLLLALRTLVVVLFVLAMARPFWITSSVLGSGSDPTHAILAIDNSMSMGYRASGQPLLDDAKKKAREFIEKLPDGSVVSIIPLCQSRDAQTPTLYRNPEDALEALDQITLADREAYAIPALERISQAARRYREQPTQRVVVVTDRQGVTWARQQLRERLGPEIAEIQFAHVGPERRTNTSVESITVQDGVASQDAPCTLVAHIRHEGESDRRDVFVKLVVDGAVVAEEHVDLVPGQQLRVPLTVQLDIPAAAGETFFVPATVSLAPDRLVEDDARSIMIPIMGQVPVLFIDSIGSQENPAMNLYGQTLPLRRLLVPTQADSAPAVYRIRHRRPDEVTRKDLADTRLVVIGGVETLSRKLVRQLRSYVEQGGQLLIGAGGEFDPVAWTQTAWLDGKGILPLPLKPDFIGQLPLADDPDAPYFKLDANTVADPLFDLGLDGRVTQELMETPIFFQAVGVDESAVDSLLVDVRNNTEQRRAALSENEAAEERWADLEARGELTEAQQEARRVARRTRQNRTRRWLTWTNPLAVAPESLSIDAWVDRTRPRVMGRYRSGAPFAVRRTMGQGQVVFVSTGFYPRWNSLAVGHGVLLFDQAMRHMISQSLPDRTLGSVDEVAIPLSAREQGASFVLHCPGEDTPRPMSVEAINQDQFGLILRQIQRRGVYTIERQDGPATTRPWTMQLAVNGPAAESELAPTPEDGLRDSFAPVVVRFTPSDSPIQLAGQTIGGGSLWKWLIGAVLLLLLVEMGIVAWGSGARKYR